MKFLDILILIPLLYGAYNGYRKGLLIEIIAIVAFVVAMIVGFKFLSFGIELLAPYISLELARKILPWLGFSVLFFPTVFLINQMGFSLRRMMRTTLLGSFDSLAGATVGIFTWVFGISVMFWLLSWMGIKMPVRQTQETYLYPLVVPLAPKIMAVTSEWIPMGNKLLEQSREYISGITEKSPVDEDPAQTVE